MNLVASGRVHNFPVFGSEFLNRDREAQAFITGLNELFVVGAMIAAVGAVLALALVRRRDFAAAAVPAQS